MNFHGLISTTSCYISFLLSLFFSFPPEKDTEAKKGSLLAQVTQLAELVPGFHCRDFVLNHYVAPAFCDQSDFQSGNEGSSLLFGTEKKRDVVIMAGDVLPLPLPINAPFVPYGRVKI